MTVGLISIVSLTAFNGGVTQTNTVNAKNGGIYPFINFMKGGSELAYNHAPTDATLPQSFPTLEVDANGYPTTIVAGTTGYSTNFAMPNNTQESGSWVLKWDGTGTIQAKPTGQFYTSSSGRLTFTNTDNAAGSTAITIAVTASSDTPNHVRNIRLCRSVDEAAMDAGAVFFPPHMALMKSAKPGAIRSLGWGGGADGTNTASIGLWAQRKPAGYVQYGGYKIDPSFFGDTTGAGITTTNSGTDYSLAYSGFTLTDKVAVHLIWNVSSPQKLASATRFTKAWSTTSGVAINISWTAHPFAVGNVVVFGQTPADGTGNIPPSGLTAAQFYFVNNVIDANNFTVSATSGGSSVLATATSSGNMYIVPIPRLNVNSTGFVPFTDFQTPIPTNVTNNGSQPVAGFWTVIYDSTTNYWHSSTVAGMQMGVPPEVFIDYCAAVGANPWMTAPFMTQTTGGALGGVTDFMPSWVTYAKNTYPWMKPLIEPYNETWNPSAAGLGTFYATSLAYTLWPAPLIAGTDRPIENAYGKWVSDLGQAMSAIYGNDRTKYSMLCMSQAGTFHDTSGLVTNDARLTSKLYVNTNGGQPAYKFADRVGVACYYNPPVTDTSEISTAFTYNIALAGNPTAQAALLETYGASANNGVDVAFTLTYVNNLFINNKAWGLGQNVNSTVPNAAGGNTVAGICAYEGGWGPDVPVASNNWATSVSASAGSLTNANPCVLTLNTSSTTSIDGGGHNITGNAGVVGMMINLSSVGGMTQLNNSTLACTFTNGSASVAATNTLIVNQAVMFTATPPAPFSQWVPYYVISTGLSGTAFQLSATRGGSALQVSAASPTTAAAQGGWFITAVGTSTITLDVDGTSFGTWTSGGTVTWTGCGIYANVIRLAAVQTTALGATNTQMNANMFALGGSGFTAEYPSNFIYFGNSGSWSILSPSMYSTLTAQWNSIVAAN